jgi:hypothetical protein
LIVNGYGVVDVEGAVFGNSAFDGLAEVGLQTIAHHLTEVALPLEFIVVDVIAKHC